MPAQIIDGKAIAEGIRGEIKSEVAALKARYDKVPGLACVIVGTRQDSQTYVRLKHKAAAECGFVSYNVELPEDVTMAQLAAQIEQLNKDDDCHGILLQLPLPKHLAEHEALEFIRVDKDVDGLLPTNVGLLHTKGRDPLFVPCTPAGVIELLQRSHIAIAGRRAVVLGRSNIVGSPVAALLMRHDATVTIAHSATPLADMKEIVLQSDIVVSAMGRPDSVPGEWIKPGAAVIDVATTPVPDATKKSGYRLAGDVCFDAARERAGWITPVPGGVGPMTIAMLLRNTLHGFKRHIGAE